MGEVWESGLVKKWTFSGHSIVILWDPASGWICGESFHPSVDGLLADQIAKFLISSCATFGFLDLEFNDFDPDLFDSVCSAYREQHSKLCEKVPELEGTSTSLIYSASSERTPIDCEIEKLESDERSPQHLDPLIWQSRFTQISGFSPFQRMFCREIHRRSLVERRTLKSSLLICRHCQESFTSKISFRIHQRRHLENALVRGELDGELVKRERQAEEESKVEDAKKGKSKKVSRLERLAESMLEADDDDGIGAKKDQLVNTVQNLLKITGLERTRRGRYLNIDRSSRECIADHAREFGDKAAAEYFSVKLNREISINTVRSLSKMYQMFEPEVRKQIGEFADIHGVEVAAKHFTQLLGRDVRLTHVKWWRKQYGRRREDRTARKGRVFSASLRQEIGEYAAVHGVEATVSMFSQKLQMPVKSGTVKKFRRLYGKDEGSSADTTTTIDLLHSSMNVLNQVGGTYCTIQYSGSSAVGQPPVLQHLPVPKFGSTPSNTQSTGGLQDTEKISGGFTKVIPNYQEESQDLSMKSHQKKDDQILPDVDEKETTKASKRTNHERGRYVQYSSELRAEIGKYAAANGTVAALRHFSAELGRTVPESTIRGLRDKYLVMSLKAEGNHVTEVGCKSRGRPSALGKHDKILMDTLERLEEKGETINSFAVIATAKQILSELGSNGKGKEANLTSHWAKSVLRRHRSRKQEKDKLTNQPESTNIS